jgi:hypothetical protein
VSNAVYFRQKAEQCRRLANAILNHNDPAREALNAMASEFDSHAAVYEAETAPKPKDDKSILISAGPRL